MKNTGSVSQERGSCLLNLFHHRNQPKGLEMSKADCSHHFDITDESGKVYVYGLLTGWNGASKQFESLGIVEGDKITICGVRASYRDSDQVGSGFFISKVTE